MLRKNSSYKCLFKQSLNKYSIYFAQSHIQMSVIDDLKKRSNGACELCTATENLKEVLVDNKIEGGESNQYALLCNICAENIESPSDYDINHWRCLNDSMWNENAAVKILIYRTLHALKAEGWPQDLLDMMYLTEEELEIAKSTLSDDDDEKIIHRDSNGVVLENGDSVVITKDLNVKGSSLVAKRGSFVRNIKLVWDNAEQLEGKVDGQNIVILTKFTKKS